MVNSLFNDATEHLRDPSDVVSGMARFHLGMLGPNANGHSRSIRQPNALSPAEFNAKFESGSLDLSDILSTWKYFQGDVLDYERNNLGAQQTFLLAAYNHNTSEQLDMFATVSTEKFIHNDASAVQPKMVELAEKGIPIASKAVAMGSNQGFSLRRFGIGLQWTRTFWEGKDMRMYAMTMEALLGADAQLIAQRLRKAFFRPTNLTFIDMLVDKSILPVKAFLNGTGGAAGDGYIIPPSPYANQTFNSAAHTHYMYCGSGNADTIGTYTSYAWSDSNATNTTRGLDLANALKNLREHFNNSNVVVYVSPADGSAYFLQTGDATNGKVNGFYSLERVTHIAGTYRDKVVGEKLDTANQYDRLCGHFDDVEIRVKPWVPTGYMMITNPVAGKPLQVRVPKGKNLGVSVAGQISLGNGDLRTIQAYDEYPLHAEAMIRDFDVCVNDRINGVAFAINSNSAYADPTA